MIKHDFRPPAFFMACETIRIRVIFCVNNILMDILMAILAVDPNFPEAPFFLLFMTFIAWNCQVRPFQLECTFIVLLHCIGKKLESIYIVTL
jgi:hypothetical protein